MMPLPLVVRLFCCLFGYASLFISGVHAADNNLDLMAMGLVGGIGLIIIGHLTAKKEEKQ